MEDNFTKNIKAQYKQPDLDIDIDAIWDNIDDRIPEKKPNRKLFWMWLGGLFVVGLFGFLAYCNLNMSVDSQQTIKQSIVKDNQVVQQSIQVFPNENDPIKKSKDINLLTEKNDKRQAVTNVLVKKDSNGSQESEKSEQFENLSISKSDFNFEKATIGDFAVEDELSNELIAYKKDRETTSFRASLDKHDVDKIDAAKIGLLNNIAAIKLNQLNVPSRMPIDITYSDLRHKDSSISFLSKFYFGTHIGVSLIKESFSAKLTEDNQFVFAQSEARTSLEAVNSGLVMGFEFSENFGLQTGVDYNQINNRFDYSGTYFEPYTRTRIDTIILIGPNEMDRLVIGSDEAAMKTINRQTKSFTKYKSIQIPLLLTLRKSNSKLNYVMSIGPQFNFSSKAEGMNFDRSNIPVDYDLSNYSSTNISWKSVIGLSFPISSKVNLDLGLQLQYHPTITSDVSYFDQSFILYGLSVQSTYRL